MMQKSPHFFNQSEQALRHLSNEDQMICQSFSRGQPFYCLTIQQDKFCRSWLKLFKLSMKNGGLVNTSKRVKFGIQLQKIQMNKCM